MSESVFESFEAYLKGADYPKGKKKIMQAAVDLISTKSYNGTSTLQIAKHAGLSQATLFKYFKTKELRKEQLYIWNTLQDKLLVLHKELIADSRVNPEITVPQMVRICIGPLLAYFAQLYIVSDNSDIREEDLNLLEKQILGGLWK